MPSAVWPSSNEEIGENKPEVIFLTRHEPHMNPKSKSGPKIVFGMVVARVSKAVAHCDNLLTRFIRTTVIFYSSSFWANMLAMMKSNY
jgi:hypothetical protein